MTEIDKYIGNMIRILREEKGKKQETLAEDLGIERTTLSNYEIGRRAIPLDILKKVAEKLNTSTDYLLGLTKSRSAKIKDREICDNTGLSDKNIKILKTIKNLDIMQFINFLIEQEEMYLYSGFSPDISKNCNQKKYNKAFERALQSYEQDVEKISKNCIPILSLMYRYFKIQPTEEDMYFINGTLKKLSDIEYKVDRYLADETINTKEVLEQTFLGKIENQLKNAKSKYKEERKK